MQVGSAAAVLILCLRAVLEHRCVPTENTLEIICLVKELIMSKEIWGT